MGKILITGALGNVGGYVAKYLIQSGEQVVVGDINNELLYKRYSDKAECKFFDFTNKDSYTVLEDVDRVFIMRPPHLGNPKDLKPFIEALKITGNIKLVCFLSLIGVENNPVPPHHKIEKYIEQAQLPYCHIRPSFFMQNISGVHSFEIKHFDNVVVPVKQAVTSFIDAEDIGELTARVLSEPRYHQNTAYELTGTEAINYYEVAKILSEELDRNITYLNPTPRLAKNYWVHIRKLDKEYAKVMGMLYMMTRFGAAKKITHTFEDILHKKPQTFREFVQKNKECWM